MRVVFFEDREDEPVTLWEQDLSLIPRIGDMVSLHMESEFLRIGKVASVEWCLYENGIPYVEIILDLM